MLLKKLANKIKERYSGQLKNCDAKTSLILLVDLLAVIVFMGIVGILVNITDYLDIFFSRWEHTSLFHSFTGDLCYILALSLCVCGVVTGVRALLAMSFITRRKVWKSCTKKQFVLKQLSFISGTMCILTFTVAGMAIDTIGVSWELRGHGFHFRAYMLNLAFLIIVLWGWWSTTHYKRLSNCPGAHTSLNDIVEV